MNQRFAFDRPPPKKEFSEPILTELEGCVALGMDKRGVATRKPDSEKAQYYGRSVRGGYRDPPDDGIPPEEAGETG